MSDNRFGLPLPPPPPDPATVTQWTQYLGQLRSLLILTGGIGLGGTWLKPLTGLTDVELSGYVSAIVTVIGTAFWIGPAIWSWVEKARTSWAVAKALRQAEVAAAVASANLTYENARPTPVTVVVTPEGEPNIAERISFAEMAAAPSVSTDVIPSPAPPPIKEVT